MAGLESLGRWLLVGGVVVALLGALIWLLARVFPGLNQLPGTIRIQTGSVTCFFPILASIIFSIILTIVLNLIARFLNK
jgi:hypothetical protein